MHNIELTKDEIMQGLYCLESMLSDYSDETTNDYKDYSSLLKKNYTHIKVYFGKNTNKVTVIEL